MNTGKVSESILKRSVLKQIKSNREEVKGAGVGKDCAFFVLNSGETEVALCSDVALSGIDNGAVFSVYKVAANLAAAGAKPTGVLVNLILPVDCEEDRIKEIMDNAQDACDKLEMVIAGGHTEISASVCEPIISITGIGQKAPAERTSVGGSQNYGELEPNLDLVVTKWIGLEGTIILVNEGKDSLLTRYPERMLDEAADFIDYLSVQSEAALAVKSGVCRMHDISRGGVLAALWEMIASAGVGLDIDLKKIPIRQETVEICEHFGLNPYALISGGSLLIAAKDGEVLVEELMRAGIPAAIIGRTTDSNDKIIRNEEDVRYLDRPAQDEIYKYLGGKSCN